MFYVISSEVYTLLFYLAIVNKVLSHVTVTLGWHDSSKEGYHSLTVTSGIGDHIARRLNNWSLTITEIYGKILLATVLY